MKIYLDSEYRCHLKNDGAMAEVQTDFFDGKCDEYVEGYRFVPYGQSWMREDGVVFHGEMIVPWKDYSVLEEAQRQYEAELIEEAEAAQAAYEQGVQEA